MPPGKEFSFHQFVQDIINLVDPDMPRCDDALLDLAQVKTILADRNPMSKQDRQAWEIADRLQQELGNEPRPRKFRVNTTKGPQLVMPEDFQIKVGKDGFIRAYSDWGPLSEQLIPFDQAIEINAGGEDELQ